MRAITSALALVPLSLVLAAPASALTAKECSAKYQAAQKAGTLNGEKWNAFRKAECSADATAATATTAIPAAPAAPERAKPSTTIARSASPASAPPAGAAVFPTAVAPKYSSESAGKARMHTCVDQYNANKATNANGGLKWIEKGGGYYAQCTSRLKG